MFANGERVVGCHVLVEGLSLLVTDSEKHQHLRRWRNDVPNFVDGGLHDEQHLLTTTTESIVILEIDLKSAKQMQRPRTKRAFLTNIHSARSSTLQEGQRTIWSARPDRLVIDLLC